MAPLIFLSVIMDSLQGVLSGSINTNLIFLLICLSLHFKMKSQPIQVSGIVRGCGWQHIGAYINLGAFYLCGILVGVALGFWTDLRGKGLWIGVQVGAFT
ncbi:Protein DETOXIFICATION 12 [Linum perenne]